MSTPPEEPAAERLPDGGPFDVQRLIGRGRTAWVYAARERIDGRAVALKVARSPAHEPSFFAEFAVAGAVQHAHLVAPDGLTRLPDGRLALVMDRVDGAPLPAVKLAGDDALRVALGVTRALCVLHGRGGHHGDLSPENVLVEAGPPPVARLIDATPGERAARVGTPGFIAPEVLAGGQQDDRADRYALGCLLFEVLLGRPLFEVPPDRLTHAHLHGAPTLPDTLSPALREALGALLIKNPDERAPGAERLLEALAEAAGLDPADELQALGRAIIGGDRVVGRAASRRPLVDALDGLGEGRGARCWLHGPRGSGRTALRRWAAAEAARRGVMPVVIAGGSRDPVAAALQAAGASPAVAAQGLTAAWVAAAEQGPRCVALDLDGLDPVGLRAVAEALGAAARLAPLAVLVFTAEAHAPPGFTAHELPPLIAAERRGIVFDRLGRDGPLAEAVADALDGPDLDRPGRVVAALGGLIDGRILVRTSGAWALDRPRLEAERAAIVDRALEQMPAELARCSPIERRLLAAFAVVGGPLDDQGIADFAGRAGLAAAGELEARGLLVDAEGAVRPARQSLARLAHGALVPGVRAALHRVAAERIEAVEGPGAADGIRHRVLAGAAVPTADRVAAAEALVAEGRSADALDVLSGAEPGGPDERADLAIAEAGIRMAQGRTDDALAALDAAGDGARGRRARLGVLMRAGRYGAVVEDARPEHDPPQDRAWVACARLWTGDKAGAEAEARALYAADPPVDPIARALAGHVLATLAWQRGALAEAERLALEALERVGESDRGLLADLSRTLGGVRIYRGDFAGAEAPLARAVELDRALGRVPELAKSLNNTGIMFYQRGVYDAARAAFEEYRLLCGRVDNPVELANVSNNLGVLALKLGEPRRAVGLCGDAMRIAREADYDWMVPVAGSNLGAALIGAGELDRAEVTLREAREGLSARGIDHELMELERRWIELALARGHREKARALAEALLGDPRLAEVPVEAAQVRRLLAECVIDEGDMGRARHLVEEAIERFDALGCRHEGAMARETRARVMVATGKFESAILEVRRAMEVHRSLGTRADLDRAGDLLDEAEERYRRSDQSVRHAQVLLELALALGACHDVEALLPTAIDAVSDLVGAERGLVALFDEVGEIERAVVRNLEWDGPGSPLPVSESVVEECRRQRRAVLVQDAVDSGAIWDRTSVALLGLRSIVCVPVMHAERVIGVLYLDSRRLVATDLDAEVELLSGVARMLGLALVNARLFAAERARSAAMVALAEGVREALDPLAEAGEAVVECQSPTARAALGAHIAEQVDRLTAAADALLAHARSTGAHVPRGTP